jgi:hypothetical protein
MVFQKCGGKGKFYWINEGMATERFRAKSIQIRVLFGDFLAIIVMVMDKLNRTATKRSTFCGEIGQHICEICLHRLKWQ